LHSLEHAVARYKGPLLEGCEEEWVFQERQEREQAYLTALETLAARAMARGDQAIAERQLRRALAVDPLREKAQRALMQVLAAGGNYAAATQAYRELRLLLHRELNAVPDPETQGLFEQIRAEARDKAARGARHAKRSEDEGRSPAEELDDALAAHGVRCTARGSGATFTFLFTDIESSTQLWEEHPESMRAALPQHDAILRQAIERHGGMVFKTFGDQFCAVFTTAPEAATAAVTAQRALQREAWDAIGPLRVRMALHSGAADEREGDYYGPTLNRVARLLQTGHGGQILLSRATHELVCDHLPEGTGLRDLGEHRFRDIARSEHVLQLLIPGLPTDFPPLRSLEAFVHNLPAQLTSFIGRQQEIARIRQILPTTRLLTVTGTGGCGKTRLALQVAADLVEEFAHGVWCIELAALSDPALVPQTVAAALGVREEPARPLTETLTAHLKARRLLLVLDNCEHLLSACARLAEALLRGCPGLQILATSREGLNIPGEMPYRLRSLSAPDPEHLPALDELVRYEAVQLFVDRATIVVPSFTLTPTNAAHVAQICRRLDGMPLAIELAAARAKALPVEKLNERLHDRFRLLTGGSRTALPRQQTLKALIDWSYDLLREEERALLRRLSVFAGGWTLEAAEAVCAGESVDGSDVLELLTQVVEKSLVVYEEGSAQGRYRLLETIRQYSFDRLREAGEAGTVQEGHCDYFLRLAEESEHHLRGPEQAVWLERLEIEHDNLRAALSWCRTANGSLERGARLAGALWWFWLVREHITAGREWLACYLPQEIGVSPTARAKVLNGAGYLARIQGHFQQAEALCQEAVTIYRQLKSERGIAWGLNTLAYTAEYLGHPQEALQRCEESLALWRKLGDAGGIGYTLHQLGGMLRSRGERGRARELATESLKLFRDLQDKRNIAFSLWLLAHVAIEEGSRRAACTYWEEALSLLREVRDRRSLLILLPELAGQEEEPLAQSAYFAEGFQLAQEMNDRQATGQLLGGVGRAAAQQGDYPRARECYRQSLAVRQEFGDISALALSLEDFAGLAMRERQWERAARLLGAAEAARAGHEVKVPISIQEERRQAVTAARTALGMERFAAAWSEGGVMSLDQAIEYAVQDCANGPTER
jgi:predicted ATPase/class 3 adenylate cyclase